MFPLRDENPTLGTSVATFVIIGLNAAAWLLVQGLGREPALSSSVCSLGAIPGNLLGSLAPGTEIRLGPGSVCLLGGDPSWITVFTSMFLHGGWLHILGNLWFLYIFGDNVEDSMGSFRFVVFYLLCGVAAVAAQAGSNPTSAVPMVGASGAIGGVMGAYAVLYPRAPVHMLVVLGFYVTRVVVPAILMLGYWLLLQLVSGIPALERSGGGVAFWAHVGGFVTGIALVFPFRNPRRVASHREHLVLARERRWH
jgi:membrane associated rhomboid family serine protease